MGMKMDIILFKRKGETMKQELIKPIEEKQEQKVCDSCSEVLNEDNEIYSEEQDKWVCQTCYDEDEPCLTIVTNDEELDAGYGTNQDGLFTAWVKHYSNDTNGEFRAKWVNSGGWRGYYDVIASKSWKKFHSDCILAYSGDSEELKDFDEKLEQYFTKNGIRFAKVFSRTSNVFSTGYDFFVRRKDFKKASDVERVMKVIETLKQKYRDDERFAMTALTGTSKRTKEGKMMLQACKLIEKGLDPESVFNSLMGVN